MRIRTVGKFASALSLVFAIAAPAAAQATAGPGTGASGVLFGAGVSFLNVSDAIEEGESEVLRGLTVDLRKNVYSGASVDVGVVGDFSWHTKGFELIDEFDEAFNVDLSLMTFMGGVRVTASQLDRVAPFGQFLIGGARPSFGGDASCDLPVFEFEDDPCSIDMAIGVGGGVDVRLTDRLNLRGQVDFIRIFSEDQATGTENTNAVRFMIGISTRLGGS